MTRLIQFDDLCRCGSGQYLVDRQWSVCIDKECIYNLKPLFKTIHEHLWTSCECDDINCEDEFCGWCEIKKEN